MFVDLSFFLNTATIITNNKKTTTTITKVFLLLFLFKSFFSKSLKFKLLTLRVAVVILSSFSNIHKHIFSGFLLLFVVVFFDVNFSLFTTTEKDEYNKNVNFYFFFTLVLLYFFSLSLSLVYCLSRVLTVSVQFLSLSSLLLNKQIIK